MAGGEAFAKAHAALLGQPGYQFAMTEYKPQPQAAWIRELTQFLQDHWPAIRIGFWIVAGVIILAVFTVLVRTYWPAISQWRFRRKPKHEATAATAAEAWRPTEAQARRLLEDSDALAAQGLYSEAVHLILLRSIEDIQERRPKLVRPTFTSREIGMLQALPEQARAAFSGITRVVERGLFAGASIGPDDFARCREDYRAFALEPVWRGAH